MADERDNVIDIAEVVTGGDEPAVEYLREIVRQIDDGEIDAPAQMVLVTSQGGDINVYGDDAIQVLGLLSAGQLHLGRLMGGE